MTVDSDLIEALRATARRFAEREVAGMVGTELRDGDLAKVPDLMSEATSIGLLPAPESAAEDDRTGIWANVSEPHGDPVSVALLEEIAVECAGFAACLHHAGLGLAELDSLEDKDAPISAVGLFSASWRPDWPSLSHPPAGVAQLREASLTGAVGPVPAAPGSKAFIIYAAGPDGWRRAWLKRDLTGLVCTDAGQRTGLAALELINLEFSDIEVTGSRELTPRQPVEYVRRLCLGLAAIALGNARGALRTAERYATERYQGGGAIAGHASIRLLIGEARSRVAAASAHLAAAALPGPAASWRAVAARHQVAAQSLDVVSACIQVLGGYGYIEDYRLAKRLRDAMTLAVSAIDANALRLMCAEAPDPA